MGTKVGRIVKDFILRSIVDTQTPLDMSFHKHRALCRVVDVNDESLELEILDGSAEGLSRGDTVRGFIHFQNNHHAFETSYLGPGPAAGDKARILLAHPEGLYKNLQRKFERVRVPDGMEIYFMLQGKRVDLGFPKARKAPLAASRRGQADQETQGLDGLVRSFKAEATGLFSANRIVMFRERQPSGTDEALVSSLGSMLWLPTIEEGLPKVQPSPDVPVITREDFAAHERSRGTSEDLVESRITQLLVDKRAKGLYAELTCPILHGEYVLGCITVSNTPPKRDRITEEQVAYVWRFSQVLAGALERNRYVAAGASDHRRFDAQVIDMSASGLLFRHPSDELSADLLVNDDIEMNLTIEGRQIHVPARVRRKYTEPGQVYYGVQFAEIAPEDYGFLFNYLYGRDPVAEDDARWEGGAPPPRVDLFGDGP